MTNEQVMDRIIVSCGIGVLKMYCNTVIAESHLVALQINET